MDQLITGQIDKKIFCTNCGRYGHISKKCLCSIISIGIVCVKLNIDNIDLNDIIAYSKKIQSNYLFSNDEINKLKILLTNINNINNYDNFIEYLLIRRKNTLNYVEIIRGKYDIYNIDYITKSINFLTIEERNIVQNTDFDVLWKRLWCSNNSNCSTDYTEAKNKFNLLKKGFTIKKNDINLFISLDILIKNAIYNFKEPEWGFPKGRRNNNEKNFDCAKREFIEETSINKDDFNIINMIPLEETYIASNSNKYKHIYYISQIKNNNIKLHIDETNFNQKIEISDIKWFLFYDAINIIRNYNIEKKNILLNLHLNIKFTIENFKNILNKYLEKI